MPYLKLKSSDGELVNFPIYSPMFTSDGTLAFFEAHINGTSITTDTSRPTKILALSRTDMSSEEWAAMVGRMGSVSVAGAALGGPMGLAIGAVVGFLASVRRRPVVDGYFLLDDKNHDNCILQGILTKRSNTYIA